MIRIRLINEGRVVKQITSRVHEGVVLEQINKYKDPFDTIQVVEGELSEGAKDMLQHVARKIIPAAMAAGVAMSGAGPAQAQGGSNPNYPGLNHSVGQHMADIFSPNYKEKLRQREHNRSTERQVWNAEQDEIRKQRVAGARASAGGGQQPVIYDQSRLSQDGKSYIIYGIDNKVRRIPVAGTEYMVGDSQRLPHYITSGGSVLYVRHPHAVTSVSDATTGNVVEQSVAEGNMPQSVIRSKQKYADMSDQEFHAAHKDKSEDTLRSMARRHGYGQDSNVYVNKHKKGQTGVAEGYTVTRGIDKERYQERPGLEGPFSTKSGKVVYYDPKEGKYYDPDTDFYIGYEDYAKMDEDATVGTIPASGTVGTSGGMGQRTQFAPTGKTTNAKFNKNGQIELDTEPEDDGSVNLDADAVKQLQQAGVQIKENEDSPVAGAIVRRIMSQRLDLLKQYGPALVTQAVDEVADFVGDVEEIGSSDVSGWVKHVEQMLRDNPPEAFGKAVTEGTDTLDGILSKFSTDYAKFKAGGDIDENQDFFDALYEYYSNSGEMPYGTMKARDGDPYEWITDRLDQESGIAPVAEADEATPGDQAAADQNIIMQIRKVSDYNKPTRIQLADGTKSIIAPNIAKQLLAKFEKMKPESKALLQDTLNTEEGFKEITAYFGGGVREQAAERASNIMQAAMAEAGFNRDAYQRDHDSSVNMDRGADHRGLNQELAHEDNDQYRVVIARGGKWEETKAQPRGPGMNAAMALINSLHAKFPTMHLGMMWPNGKVENYGKKA
jgi:hypothetical protein